MDRWVDGWMNGWVDGWMDGWMDGRTFWTPDRQTEESCGKVLTYMQA